MATAVCACRGDEVAAYDDRRLNRAIERCANTRWCPGAGCESVLVVAHASRTPLTVECGCGFSACWGCLRRVPLPDSLVSHRPATCRMAQRWARYVKMMEELDPDALAVQSRVRSCPQCGLRFEKTGGCESMTCPTKFGGCGYQFCFQCGRDWKKYHVDHYECSSATLSADVGAARLAEDKLKDLRPFKKKYDFVQGYHEAAKVARAPLLQQEGLEDVEMLLRVGLRKGGVEGADADAALRRLQDVSEVVAKCRDAGAWSNVALVFIADIEAADPRKAELFRFNQPSLAKFTAQLQARLEQELPRLVRDESTPYTTLRRFLDALQDEARAILRYREDIGADLVGIDEDVDEQPADLPREAPPLPDRWRCHACTVMVVGDPRGRQCPVCNTPRKDPPPPAAAADRDDAGMDEDVVAAAAAAGVYHGNPDDYGE